MGLTTLKAVLRALLTSKVTVIHLILFFHLYRSIERNEQERRMNASVGQSAVLFYIFQTVFL